MGLPRGIAVAAAVAIVCTGCGTGSTDAGSAGSSSGQNRPDPTTGASTPLTPTEVEAIACEATQQARPFGTPQSVTVFGTTGAVVSGLGLSDPSIGGSLQLPARAPVGFAVVRGTFRTSLLEPSSSGTTTVYVAAFTPDGESLTEGDGEGVAVSWPASPGSSFGALGQGTSVAPPDFGCSAVGFPSQGASG